jgi:alpha 1,2-mannosyltransferase
MRHMLYVRSLGAASQFMLSSCSVCLAICKSAIAFFAANLTKRVSLAFQVPVEHWSYPAWINVTRADEERARMAAAGVLYGGSLSYRFMCRYNSGFIFRHPLLAPYKYYWRIEPGVHFSCTLKFDPFTHMRMYGKRYAFVITMQEIAETIPTLWNATRAFAAGLDTAADGNGHLELFLDRNGTYNNCHYWSNFEVADLDFYRSPEYLAYFEHLDRAGGFFCVPFNSCVLAASWLHMKLHA